LNNSNLKYTVFFTIGLILSLALSFAVGETLIRTGRFSKIWENYKDRQVIKEVYAGNKVLNNNKVGYKYHPNIRFTSVRNSHYKINTLGYRDDNVKRSKKVKVAVCGDSIIEGFGIQKEDRLTEVAEKGINKISENKIDMINFGSSGHCTYDEFHVIKNDVVPIRPDILLLQLYFYDFDDNIKIYNHIKVSDSTFQYTSPKTNNNNELLDLFRKHSALYLFLAEQYNTYRLRNDLPHPVMKRMLAFSKKDFMITENVLDSIVQICKTHNIKPIFFYSPMEAEVKIKKEKSAFHINNMIEVYCKNKDIPLISPLKYFRENISKDIYMDGGHYTKLGNKLCGQYIAENIIPEL